MTQMLVFVFYLVLLQVFGQFYVNWSIYFPGDLPRDLPRGEQSSWNFGKLDLASGQTGQRCTLFSGGVDLVRQFGSAILLVWQDHQVFLLIFSSFGHKRSFFFTTNLFLYCKITTPYLELSLPAGWKAPHDNYESLVEQSWLDGFVIAQPIFCTGQYTSAILRTFCVINMLLLNLKIIILVHVVCYDTLPAQV